MESRFFMPIWSFPTILIAREIDYYELYCHIRRKYNEKSI
jgi:hypothetical protein